MKSGELKIYYREEEEPINAGLDQALEDILKKFGYRRRASSISNINKIRDLAFEKKD